MIPKQRPRGALGGRVDAALSMEHGETAGIVKKREAARDRKPRTIR
jgi:hypothetical protein